MIRKKAYYTRLVGVCSATINNWIKSGDLKATNVGGSVGWVIDENDFADFMENRCLNPRAVEAYTHNAFNKKNGDII